MRDGAGGNILVLQELKAYAPARVQPALSFSSRKLSELACNPGRNEVDGV